MSAFMASRLFSIPAHQPFATTLARALLDEVADDPRALSRLTILLPTRRAIIAMRAAFLAAAPGRALLLPTMAALGDVGEGDGAEDLTPSLLTGGGRVGEKPAIGELDRLSLLTTLVYRRLSQDRPLTDVPPLDQAARLADELARFMDRVQTAGLDFSGLETLVPNVGNLAEHWQQSLTFLEIVTKAWPHVLADHGCQDAAERRHRLMMTLAEAWREQPPNAPIIAAGSTGSIPATRNLLAVIASLPQGRVILPGLDKAADDREWQAIGQDPTHPQFGLAELLDAVGAERDAVTELADRPADDHHHRQHLLSLAMRPAKVSDVWAETALDPAASRGITLVDCEHAGEEASVIALILREALEHEGKTAALVTPDRSLAKRVASLVGRWGIAIDDSAGTPLSETPIGTYLRALAELGAQPRDAIAWMSLLKHPFARAGQSAAGFGQFVRGFDLALRDDRAGSPFSVLQEVGGPVARSIEQVLSPFFDALEGPAGPLSDHLAVQVQVAEGLADDDARAGRDRLWADEDGEAAASFIDELSSALDRLPHADFANFAGLFETLLGGRVVRSARTTHPRLAIWGPLEARLQTADRVILGGLNEGTWPRDPAPDPWMSFDMQLTFGLAPPQRVVGLAAHDFVQSFAAEEVFLTRAGRVDGVSSQPSRFIRRLETVLKGARLDGLGKRGQRWVALARSLDREAGDGRRLAPPAPKPAQDVRPKRLAQTDIAMLMRDPYAVYARRILGLEALGGLARGPEARDRGIILHAVLASELRALGRRPTSRADAERLKRAIEPELADLREDANVQVFWRHRFHRAIDWFVSHEAQRDADWAWHALERKLETQIGGVIVTAKADRIDIHPTEGLAIIDYKTGGLPDQKDIEAGLEPQLALEMILLSQSDDPVLRDGAVAALEYWRMSGGREAGKPKDLANPDGLAEAAAGGVVALIRWFADPENPYLSRVRPKGDRRGDYDHLARVGEWLPQDWVPE